MLAEKGPEQATCEMVIANLRQEVGDLANYIEVTVADGRPLV